MLILCIQQNRMLCGCMSWCKRAIRSLGELTACMFRPCLSLAVKHHSCLCAAAQSLYTHLHFQESPNWFCQPAAAGVQAGFSTAQFVCLFAHDTASILFIREKCLPPMAQNHLQVEKRQMQMCVCKRKHVKSL